MVETIRSAIKVKFVALESVPEGVVTLTLPEVVPDATTAVICEALFIVNEAAGVVLINTAVAPVKFVPLITIVVPTPPLLGVNVVTVGGVVTVKLVPLVPVPEPFTTDIAPVVADGGTKAVMLVALFTVYDAFMPLNLTAVIALKLVPVIATDVPTGPLPGVNEATVGAPKTVNGEDDSTLSTPLVTLIFPVVAPVGTVVVMVVLFTTVNDAAKPLNLTPVAHVNPVPVMETAVPNVPSVGVNDVMVGAGITTKLNALVPVPNGLVTEIGPVVAPAGTVVVMVVSFTTVYVPCGVPLNETADAPVNNVPRMVTAIPTEAAAGVTAVMVGGAVNSVPVKVIALPVEDNPETLAIPVDAFELVVNCVVHDVGTATLDVAKRILFPLLVLPKLAALKL